jgi:hypothetical protein
MGHAREKLKALVVERLSKRPGLHSDGGGLCLRVTSPTSASWVFRYMMDRKVHEMGLGKYPDVSLARAREKAGVARSLKADGHDPIVVATLFPPLLAMAQFASWQAVPGVFVSPSIIQFVIGSYVEPRVSGNVLSISLLVVLFAVFFWTILWDLYGAFIGVPIAIDALTFCSHHPSIQWIADLLGGPAPAKTSTRN